ncbi:MAG: hypothetical protein A3K19_28390 [Lentisphaerae bacterium RIFOXYB12_FULL_65_16]|nr:MAG: hypothetical protein A3K18_19640 [Lentisphaerae bacterium RIFOXYA12_64_32]OGV85507.1 MAG: hypothetical protein A3K19_28390 [Lentisphaerae bacterium RIFOXYB12_FULL_65_16]
MPDTSNPLQVQPDSEQERPTGASRWRLRLTRCGLVGLSLALALLAGEVIVRLATCGRMGQRYGHFIVESVAPEDAADSLADPLIGPGLTVAGDGRGYRLRRSLRSRFVSIEYDTRLTTNEQGLRSPPLRRDPTFRILCLGDSFCMGMGVDDDRSYSAVLQSLVRHEGWDDVEVVNAGVLGYNPGPMYAFFENEGLALAPRIVVLEFWVGDDVYCAPGSAIPRLRSQVTVRDRIQAAAFKSHLLLLTMERLRGIRPVRRWLLDAGVLSRYPSDMLLREGEADRHKDKIDALGRLLVRFKQLCDSRQIQLLLVLMPVREQVSTEFWEATVAYNLRPGPPPKPDLLGPNRTMKQLTEAAGIEMLDLLPVIAAANRVEACYFPKWDVHFNERGHQVVAQELFRRLEERLRKDSEAGRRQGKTPDGRPAGAPGP